MAADNATVTRQPGIDLLGIYLNDHLVGATSGAELARRVARSHGGGQAGENHQRLREKCPLEP